MKLFAPSSASHAKVLDMLALRTTEIAYITKETRFLDNALSFMSGVVWVTEEVTYQEASRAADLICSGFDALAALLKKGTKGFLGEVVVYPDSDREGLIIPVKFNVDGETYLMCMLGRYFGYSHYMNQLHPYSTAIIRNKSKGKAYGVYNRVFLSLYKTTINTLKRNHKIDMICSVPARPGQEDRFKKIIEELASDNEIENLNASFNCISNYPIQKASSQMERESNVKDAFVLSNRIDGATVVLIDDIVTTGSTLKACIRELKAKGAGEVICIVLGINQLGGTYWSSDAPELYCQDCGNKMKMMVNSNDGSFFYSCFGPNCRGVSFREAKRRIQTQVECRIDVTEKDYIL
ncbi:phosphoribosyltransferase family protein [Butyrivibrio sp. VCD2006]|uniref:phosphoribosyltransferase family protein n=1 Tax=Butyrivibrio sp. VCD2006 TaxID=1280664 RepID=UPI001A9A4655|nr:phosphoribosyltransferase family protein [Butyrivibrio sp. VCD2006]